MAKTVEINKRVLKRILTSVCNTHEVVDSFAYGYCAFCSGERNGRQAEIKHMRNCIVLKAKELLTTV